MKKLTFNNELEKQILLEKRKKEKENDSSPFILSMILGLFIMLVSLPLLDVNSEWHLSFMVLTFILATVILLYIYFLFFNFKTKKIESISTNDENYEATFENSLEICSELLKKIDNHKANLNNLSFEDKFKVLFELKSSVYVIDSENPYIKNFKTSAISYLNELERIMSKSHSVKSNEIRLTNGVVEEYEKTLNTLSLAKNHILNIKS